MKRKLFFFGGIIGMVIIAAAFAVMKASANSTAPLIVAETPAIAQEPAVVTYCFNPLDKVVEVTLTGITDENKDEYGLTMAVQSPTAPVWLMVASPIAPYWAITGPTTRLSYTPQLNQKLTVEQVRITLLPKRVLDEQYKGHLGKDYIPIEGINIRSAS